METYNRSGDSKSLSDVTNAVIRSQLGTRAFSSAGLTYGSSAATAVKIANTVPYCIDNVLYSKTTAEIAFTDLTVQAAATTCYYLLSLDSAGTGTLTTGSALGLPACPADQCPIGYVKIVTDSDSTFTPGTTELSAATTFDSVTYVNLSQMPLSV
jgi:hypothetical protein